MADAFLQRFRCGVVVDRQGGFESGDVDVCHHAVGVLVEEAGVFGVLFGRQTAWASAFDGAGLDAALNVEIGTTDVALDSRRNVVRSEESSMGNLIADAMRVQTGADIGLMNGGGIRADRTYDAGAKLTRRDILTELPFGNTTQVTELPGTQVLLVLENAVSQVEKGAGRFAQVSGLTFTYDPTAEPGARVSEVMVAGAPLAPDSLYKVAVNDYILGGGDGYDSLGGGKLDPSVGGRLVANDVMDYIEKAGTVAPAVEGRIKVLGK